ncbi:MAG: TIGR02444 family protein [Proteobacteria bacterium]|nr:TIGR02444 family protein [Pseudomonadota bacterium]
MGARAGEDGARGSPLWRFSLGFYRRPGVGDVCIDLQDGCGVDVNLLLFLLWRARAGRLLTVEAVGALDARARPWRETCVVALRLLRRQLKGQTLVVAAPEAEAFRTRVKALELEAERLLQEAMHALALAGAIAEEAAAPDAAARGNIAAYERVLGREFPAAAKSLLLERLSED